MLAVFWCAVGFVTYTYVGYPLLIWLLSRLRPDYHGSLENSGASPTICVIVPAFNEEGRIAAKIENLLAQDYPREKLELLFVSDGSTDSTAQRVESSAAARLIAYQQRLGKPHALAAGVAATTAEVIVFADVRQRLVPGALKCLVATLQVPGIGVVSGDLVHIEPGSSQAARIGLYWRYEKLIRRAESRWSSTVGTTGALYAIRRADFAPVAEDTILDDFEIPMAIVRRRQRAVIDTRAIMFDELQKETRGERQRKVRTLTGNFQSFMRHPWLFSPLANPVWFQFISHKVFRLFVPYALAAALISSVLLGGPFFLTIAVLQVLFYALAGLGRLSSGAREHPLVSFPTVFVELNVAAVVALCRYATGHASARWEKT